MYKLICVPPFVWWGTGLFLVSSLIIFHLISPESLTESGTCLFNWSSWPASPRYLSAHPCLPSAGITGTLHHVIGMIKFRPSRSHDKNFYQWSYFSRPLKNMSLRQLSIKDRKAKVWKTNISRRLNVCCPLPKIQIQTVCALLDINILHSQEDGGSEERIVFDLDTYFHLEIAGSSITRGKHLTVMLGVGPRDWQPGSG